MALETKPAKDPAAEDKHELGSQAQGGAGHRAGAGREGVFGKGSAMRLGDQPSRTSR